MQVENVPDPKILNDRDAIVRITSTAICGSDLHLYDGYIPTMKKGDILGHEFMGEVVEVGPGVGEPRRSATASSCRSRSPAATAGRASTSCTRCARTPTRTPGMAEKMFGHPTAGIFGYSHLTGGYAGGQAEYARVPFADVGPFKIEDDLPDEQVLFLSDIFPTGYMGAEFCDIQRRRGDRRLRRRARRPVRDRQRRDARRRAGHRDRPVSTTGCRWRATGPAPPTSINFAEDADVVEQLKALTGGRGPDAVIDAVGMEAAHGHGALHAVDRVKQATRIGERPRARAARRDPRLPARRHRLGHRRLRRADGQVPDRARFMNKGLTIKTGQCHVQRYLKPLYERIRNGDIDPSFVDHAPPGARRWRPTATRRSSTSRTSA